MSVDSDAARRCFRGAVIAGLAVLSFTVAGVALAQAGPFTDIAGNTHEDNIKQLADLGITVGKTPDTYAPRENVRRDQMASFLIRTLEHAHPERELRWRLEIVDTAFVLPDGTTISEDDAGIQQQTPVGSQFYSTSNVWAVDADGERDEIIGTEHVTCVFGVDPDSYSCDLAFILDDRGTLHGTYALTVEDEGDAFAFDLAVTGGTGEFAGATGDLDYRGEVLADTRVSGTVILHGTR